MSEPIPTDIAASPSPSRVPWVVAGVAVVIALVAVAFLILDDDDKGVDVVAASSSKSTTTVEDKGDLASDTETTLAPTDPADKPPVTPGRPNPTNPPSSDGSTSTTDGSTTSSTTSTSTSTSSTSSTSTTLSTTTTQPVTLNFSLPAVFGSTSLTAGFVPDPRTVTLTAGGPANTSYLGGGCSGHTTGAPSFSVNYTAGAFPTLRFYFVGGGDTTIIVNTPAGSYVCVDDSFGTLHPTIDFNSPSSGRYDIWIGTYAPGASIGGTLSITENTGNHP